MLAMRTLFEGCKYPKDSAQSTLHLDLPYEDCLGCVRGLIGPVGGILQGREYLFLNDGLFFWVLLPLFTVQSSKNLKVPSLTPSQVVDIVKDKNSGYNIFTIS